MIAFPTCGGSARGYLAVPEGGDVPGVLVLHAWWGLNGFFKGFCDRLAEEGFVVLAPDLYHGKVSSTITGAKRLRSKLKSALVERELIGAVDYMRTSVATNEGKIGVVGFSLGANLGLWLSESRPEDVAAVVIFYGTRRGSFKKTKAAFQGHFADHDEWEPLKDVQKMEGEIKSARREITSYLYPGTRHWFFEADRRTAYDSDAAEKAWRRTVRFLHAQLG